MKNTTKEKNHKVLVAGKFYSAPVSVNKRFVTIRFPRKVADYFALTGKKIFWAPVNGVIQLSPSSQPHVSLSAMSVTTEQFVPHEEVINAGNE